MINQTPTVRLSGISELRFRVSEEQKRGLVMSGYTAEKSRRKAAVRDVRRAQREVDSALERIERRLFRLLRFKDIITRENLVSLIPMYNEYVAKQRVLEKALADLFAIVSV